jgi:hypothetical protein
MVQKTFQKLPQMYHQAKKKQQKKTQTITPSVPSRKRKVKKKFSNNFQMYPQEKKRVKEKVSKKCSKEGPLSKVFFLQNFFKIRPKRNGNNLPKGIFFLN